MKLIQWRTVLAVLAVLVVSLVALTVLSLLSTAGLPRETLFSSWVTLATVAIIALASKSGIEHLAGGGGIKDAALALFTSRKPEPPAGP